MALQQEIARTESIEDFSSRVRAWAQDHLGRVGDSGTEDPLGRRVLELGLDPSDPISRGRAILRLMSDAGFSGLVFPVEFGGQGLSPDYLRAFNAAVADYDVSGLGAWTLTLGMNAPTMLEYGTEDQKRTYLPRMFRGEDLWIQFLSEPTGGSDLASALTSAVRDGDEWVLNGSKIWTSTADRADWGMCLARTDWDAPKHRGLSVFLVPMRSEGLTITPLKMISGQTGFCQEYFDNVRIPRDALLGDENNGWAIASRLLVHERNVLNGGSEYWAPPRGGFGMTSLTARGRDDLVDLAVETGQAEDAHVRQLVAEAYANSRVASQLGPRVTVAMATGLVPPAASSILKLMNSVNGIRRSDITMEIAGPAAVASRSDDGPSQVRGISYLSRQTGSLVSGTSEIQRNIISERVLQLPREPSPDRELPFREVRHNPMPSRFAQRP